MSVPTDKKDIIIAIFDSFSKALLRNESRNIVKKLRNSARREVTLRSRLQASRVFCEDSYPTERFTLTHGELFCTIDNDWLYEALRALPDQQCAILMLSFWYGWKDAEIAEHLGVTVRTVHNLRKRAFAAIRQFYGWTEKSYRTDP